MKKSYQRVISLSLALLLILVIFPSLLKPVLAVPNPTWSTTRAQAAYLIVQAKEPALFTNGTTPTSNPFNDVPVQNWAYPALQWANSRGWISSATNFRPNDNITREELAVLLCNAFSPAYSNINLHNMFTDAGQISSWAYQSVQRVVNAGWINGSGNI